MKSILLIFIIFFTKLAFASGCIITDSITPPPEFPVEISGDTITCVGETTVYTADIPISCSANWYIDGELQTSTTGILEVIWIESGSFLITLNFVCDTNIYIADSLFVIVEDVPSNPSPITGKTEVCRLSTENYTTTVGDGETCQWIVDGVIQVSDTTTMSYYWVELGVHNIEVRAVNECGVGDAVFLDVDVVELPIVNLGNDTTILQGQSVELDAGNQGCTYLWSTGETTQVITISQSGNYNVVATNACGDAIDEITVDVVVDIEEYVKVKELIIVVTDNYLSVNIQDASIEKVQIWDTSGKLLLNYNHRLMYYLPQKGVFIVKVFTVGGVYYSKKIMK